MLGKTASGIFWLNRYLERAEASSRLLSAGFLIALTRAASAANEWDSILTTTGQIDGFIARHGEARSTEKVIDFLLLDRTNPSSILSMIKTARDNARQVRTALTREVWEAINAGWMEFDCWKRSRVREREIPDMLAAVRRYTALVRGAAISTMLRNDIYNFQQIGCYIERADNTARLLDVKYYLLLPSVSAVGSAIDVAQWETILRSVSAQRSYRWQYGYDISALGVARYLILDRAMPRSLAFCHSQLELNLRFLGQEYDEVPPSHALSIQTRERFFRQPMEEIFAQGLHEYICAFLVANNALSAAIQADFRFEPES